MKLSVYERLALLTVLPEKGSYTTLKLMRTLREELSFSEEEHQTLDLQQVPDGKGGAITQWHPDRLADKEIEIGPVMHQAIVDSLKRMDRQQTLTTEHMPLYERFMVDAEPAN